jgi:hypothetical protein
MAEELSDLHPNAPRRGPVLLAFGSVVIAGLLGALIGYGLVDATCRERPSRLQQLLEAAIPGYKANAYSCTWPLAVATVVGATLAAVGAGIVAVLVLRAMNDWRRPPAQ